MEILSIIILFIIGINLIPSLINVKQPRLERFISKLAIFFIIVYLINVIFLFNDYKLKGTNTYKVIFSAFIISTLLFFGIVKNSWAKLLKALILIPLIAIGYFAFVFYVEVDTYKINDKYQIDVSNGGFLSCGELIIISESKFIFFIKRIFFENSLCLSGVNNIEVVEWKNNSGTFLIYHDGERDSENPYKYNVQLNVLL